MIKKCSEKTIKDCAVFIFLIFFTFCFGQNLMSKDYVIEQIESSKISYKDLSIEWRKDFDVTICAVKKDGRNLKFADYSLRNNDEVVAHAIYNCASSFEFANELIRLNKKAILKVLNYDNYCDPMYFQLNEVNKVLSKFHLDDSCDYFKIYDFLSPTLKKDKDILLALLDNHRNIEKLFNKLTPTLKIELLNDKVFVLRAIAKDPNVFSLLDEKLKCDENFILQSIESNCLVFDYLDEKVITREIVLAALKKYGVFYKEIPIKYRAYYNPLDASSIIVKDPELLLTAVGSRGEIYTDLLDFVDSTEHNWVEKWLDRNYFHLKPPEGSADLDYLLHHNYEFALAAVKSYEKAFKYVPEKFMTKELVIAAVKTSTKNLDIIPERFKNNKEIALAAVNSDWQAYTNLSDSIQLDIEVQYAYYKGALTEDPTIYNNRSSKEVVEQCVQFDYSLMYYADSTLKKDKDYALKLIEYNGNLLKYLHNNLKGDKDIVTRAFKKNSESIQYADKSLMKNREFALELFSSKVKTEEEARTIRFASGRIKLSDYFIPTNLNFYSSKANQNIRQALLKDSIGIHNCYLSLDKSLKSDIEISKNFVLWNPSYFALIDKAIGEKLLNDADFIKKFIEIDGEVILIANDKFLKDTANVLVAIQSQPSVFKFLDANLKSNKNFIKRCFDINPLIFPYLSREYTLNRDFVFNALKRNGLILEFLDSKFKNDERLIIEALKQNGLALKFVSDRFKNNNALVNIAIKQNGLALEFASDSLRNSEDIALTALLQNKKSYKFIGETAFNSINVVKEYFKIMIMDGIVKYDDSEIAKIYCQLDGNFLSYFSDKIKNDTSVVRIAIQNNGASIRFASDNLRGDKNFILSTIKSYNPPILELFLKILEEVKNGYKCTISEDETDIVYVFKFMDEKLHLDKDLFLKVIKEHPCALQFANPNLLSDLDFMLRCVDSNGLCIQFANKDLILSPKLQFAAVKSTGKALILLDSNCLSNRELVLLASKTYGEVIELCPQFKNDKMVVSEALKNDGLMLEFTGSKLRSNKAIIELAIQNNGLALEFVDEKFKKDKEIIKKAILNNPAAFEFTSIKLRKNKKYVMSLLKDCTPNLVGIDSLLLADEEVMQLINIDINIGQQKWMNQNLSVSNFLNGDPIPEAKTVIEWKRAMKNQEPAWCYYDNDPANGSKYGKLYNWYAVNDKRGMAPVGYHVPSDDEWKELSNFLGGDRVVGIKMKSTNGWIDFKGNKRGNGNNKCGFNGLPGGYRDSRGKFFDQGMSGDWWSVSGLNNYDAYYRNLDYFDDELGRVASGKAYGFSVRCLKD